MHIERVPNRNSPPAVLLRQSYREGGKVRKRTLANLSKLPDNAIEGLRVLLKGGIAITSLDDAFEIQRSLPHGHVAAVLGTLENVGLKSLISPESSRQKDLVIALIAARILDPASKLATARGLARETCGNTLGEILGVEEADSDELYEAMDWLLEQQGKIEENLAAKHLAEGTLILYDVTSTYFEGETCPLAQYGYSRDKKKGKLQIIFGLLCNASGCPIAVEVFEGNVNDSKTLAAVLEKVRHRFGIQRVVLVGDRGVLTSAQIQNSLKTVEGIDWITALRAPQIRELMEQKYLQLSLVVPVERQAARQRKAQRKRTLDDFPVHSFRTLLTDLATIVKNRVQPKLPGVSLSFDKITNPTPSQQAALDLLGVSLCM
ncbi:MAG: IS1634 family transposase [Coleofasciculus sp. C3-bin4]|nr:IS1634 family transposase [Coleofasciculus sp. C3-bin4]